MFRKGKAVIKNMSVGAFFAFVVLISLMAVVYFKLPEREKYNREGCLLIPENKAELSRYNPEELVRVKNFWEEKAQKFGGSLREFCLERVKEVEEFLK